jgi:hypothetical protein
MTYEELIKLIDEDLATWAITNIEEPPIGVDSFHLNVALRAVVELHKPYESYLGTACLECSEVLEIPYPCHTIQAIVKELQWTS